MSFRPERVRPVEVSPEKLFEVIGRQAMEILCLREQLATAQQSVAEAVGEINRLRGAVATCDGGTDQP